MWCIICVVVCCFSCAIDVVFQKVKVLPVSFPEAIQVRFEVEVKVKVKVVPLSKLLFMWLILLNLLRHLCLNSAYAFWFGCRSPSVENPGNNLYVTGLSPRITRRELEKHFASEGKVCVGMPPLSILFYIFSSSKDCGFELQFTLFLNLLVWVCRWLTFILWLIHGQENLVDLGLLPWKMLTWLTAVSSI